MRYIITLLARMFRVSESTDVLMAQDAPVLMSPTPPEPPVALEETVHIRAIAEEACVSLDEVLDLLDDLGMSIRRDGMIEPMLARSLFAAVVVRDNQTRRALAAMATVAA